MISHARISPSCVEDDAGWRRMTGLNCDPSLGGNLNGPSVIRVPDWCENALAKFGHHRGKLICLACADHPKGPWEVHEPGPLTPEQVPQLWNHTVSPDVHADHQRRIIRMKVQIPTPAPRHRTTKPHCR